MANEVDDDVVEAEEEIISMALLACRCHRALMIEMEERWVHLHLPGGSSREREKKRKKEKKDLSSTISLRLRPHLFIIQSCPLLVNNMPIVVSSAHLASALIRRLLRRREDEDRSVVLFLVSLSFAVG